MMKDTIFLSSLEGLASIQSGEELKKWMKDKMSFLVPCKGALVALASITPRLDCTLKIIHDDFKELSIFTGRRDAHYSHRSAFMRWLHNAQPDWSLHEEKEGKGSKSILSLGYRSKYEKICTFIRFYDVSRSNAIEERYLEMLMPSLHRAVLNGVQDNDIPGHEVNPLTPREQELIPWLRAGKTNWEISRILGISEHTVQTHLRNIREKMNVTSRSEIVMIASRIPYSLH